MVIEVKSGDLLTEDQISKNFAIYAGPGSGKTHFLVQNIKEIVTKHPVIVKSNERKVLCITYTNAAVDEIKRRLDSFSLSVTVSTIHRFIIDNIIIPFQSDLRQIMKKDFNIEINRESLITSQIEGVSILHGHERLIINEYLKEVTGCSDIDYSKLLLSKVEVDNKTFIEKKIAELYHPQKVNPNHALHIKKYLWQNVGKLTHNEILYFGYRMLQENSVIAYTLRVKYPFIFIDEFQDTSPIQTQILKLLAEKSSIVGVVGDVAQSIYSFQGASPSQFSNLRMPGDIEIAKYCILENRRSTSNIVNFCNFLRGSDELMQISVKLYENEEERKKSEKIPIHFIFGDSPETIEYINNLIQDEGVVLTRTWAAAFSYIKNIDKNQRECLKKIYNSYYNTTIDIRSDIVEHHRVKWVKAFGFIQLLYSASRSGSLIDVLHAIGLYSNISNIKKKGGIPPKTILLLRQFLNKVFESTTSDMLVVDVIQKFNQTLHSEEFQKLQKEVFEDDFTIQYVNDISDFDKKNVEALNCITWDTAFKLFSETFTKNSKYMTVHQSKGLEWDTVVVAVNPTRNDKTSIESLFASPGIVGENNKDEFNRMYYVACSRAKKRLYIHLHNDDGLKEIIKQKLDQYNYKNNPFEYEFIEI